MKELDYIEKKEKLPIGPCRGRQWPPAPGYVR